MTSSITSPLLNSEDKDTESYLRPKSFSEFIGQEDVKSELKIAIEALKQRRGGTTYGGRTYGGTTYGSTTYGSITYGSTTSKGDVLDHILFFGPPGLGKTTLSYIVANELDVKIKAVQAPTLQVVADLAAILSSLEENSILFIDEIHRLHPAVEELLYQAMENFSLDIIIGKGPGARTLHLPLCKFTLIGATTRVSMLTAPLRNRFGIVQRLDYYSEEELKDIVKLTADKLDIKLNDDAAYKIACCSRGTPRIANRLLRRIRDFAQLKVGLKVEITLELVKEALHNLNVGEDGLDKLDRLILNTIKDRFGGGPVGLKTLAATIQEDERTIEDVYEPYLLRLGYIIRTPKGRCLTPQAYKKLFY